MALDSVKNLTKVTLARGYNASDTSVDLTSGGGDLLPAPPFNMTWYNATNYTDPSDDPKVEIVRITAITDDTLTIIRAQEDTAATTKNTSGCTYRMLLTITAKMITDIGDALGSEGVAGSNKEIQFNDSGVFGASAAFTFDQDTNTVLLGTENGVGEIIGPDAGSADTAGGGIDIIGGAGRGTGTGGEASINGGPGGVTGNGGQAIVTSGSGGSTSGDGGTLSLVSGDATAGDGGEIDITGGFGGGGRGGNTQIQAGSGLNGGLATLGAGDSTSDGGSTGYVAIYGGHAEFGNTDGGQAIVQSGNGFGSGNGGQVNITGGSPGSTGQGGVVLIRAGDTLTTGTNTPGNVNIYGGLSQLSGVKSGGVNIYGGFGSTGNAAGGDVVFQAGIGVGSSAGGTASLAGGSGGSSNGNGGDIYIYGGPKGGSGTDGKVKLINPSSLISAILSTSTLSSTDKTFTFPNTSGTIALTSDIPAAGANTALSNLASVAINTSLLPGTDDGAALGSTSKEFSDLFLASGGVINWASGNATLTHSTGTLTSNVPLAITAGSAIVLGAASSTNGAIVFKNASNTNNLTLRSGATASNLAFTLPTADGTSGQVIKTNGSGVLSWVDALTVAASNDLTGQTAAVASITSTTAPNDGSQHTYNVGGYVDVNSVTASTVTLQVTFTDENNTVQTLSFFGQGLTTAALATTGFIAYPSMTIRAKANTSITIKTITSVTPTVNYDVGGYIMKIN